MDFPKVSQSLWIVAVAGLIVHLIFKRTETRRPLWIFVLLVATPGCLTYLYLPHADGTIVAAVKVFGLFWSTLVTSILVYRVSPWHPLAKYPGPLICKLTKFHVACLAFGGKQYLYFFELHRKYGDVVRIGPNELSIRDVDSITALMSNNGFKKGAFWSGRIPEDRKETVVVLTNGKEEQYVLEIRPLIAIVDRQEHARRKRPWSRGFNTSAVKGYESFVIERTLQLVKILSSKNLKETINLSTWFHFLSYDVMNDVAFSGGSEKMRDGDVMGQLHEFAAIQYIAIFFSQVPWLGAMILSFPQLVSGPKKILADAHTRAICRIKEGSTSKDLFHHLIDEDNVNTYKSSLSEVISDGDLTILAGSDTTSNAITNVLYFLMTNPTIYKRLQTEIDGLGDNVMDCATQARLPYLNAVIHESLRLIPLVISGAQRAADTGAGGKMAGSIFIPEGSHAFIHTYSLQRDPRYFSPVPHSFLPERWLSEEQRVALEPKIFNSQEKYVHNTDAFIPFSAGPTNCPGKNLALLEMRMVVSLMISRFDFKLDPSYDPQQWYEDLCDYYVILQGPLPTYLSLRQSVIS